MVRKPNKHFFKKNRNGTITFNSQEALSSYIKQSVEEQTEIYKGLMQREIYEDIEKQTEIIARDVLNRLWGFGKKRQDYFLKAYNYQIECITENLVTFEDIEMLNEK